MIEFQGLDELEGALAGLEEKLRTQYLQSAVHQAAELVRSDAASRAPYNTGNLKSSEQNGILSDVVSDSCGMQGIVYTNAEYAPYVEFGTGPKGRENHKGISPNVTPQYTPKPFWWIPEGEGDGHIRKEVADKYHMPRFETKEGEAFRYSEGQPAHPFMYPALKDNEEKCIKKIAGVLRKELKKDL